MKPIPSIHDPSFLSEVKFPVLNVIFIDIFAIKMPIKQYPLTSNSNIVRYSLLALRQNHIYKVNGDLICFLPGFKNCSHL